LPGDKLESVLRAQLAPRPACELLDRALLHAQQLGRSPRLVVELRRWLMVICINADADEYYARNAAQVLAIIRRDSGRDDWDALANTPDPGQRLMAALTAASERYAALPPEQRTYTVEEAIKQLVIWVVISIAVGARTVDSRLIKSLPPLIEPFAPLSPIIDAIYQNTLATRQTAVDAQFFQARERWLGVMEKLNQVQGDALQHVDQIRGAIAFALGCLEAGRGFPGAEKWAHLVEADVLQQVSGMYLRKVACLQQGDWDGAERCRRAAELLALQANTPQMFASQMIELTAHYMASDLAGVQQISARVDTFAKKYRGGWKPWSLLAQGYFHVLRGDPESALEVLERGLAMSSPDSTDPDSALTTRPNLAGAYAQPLVNAGRYEDARRYGEKARGDAERLDIRTLDDVVRALALAETRLGAYPQACARLQVLIDRQLGLGVTGLHLGASYEARARIAIIANDQPAVEIYARLTAEQYRHGRGSPLGVRYEALMAEARSAGVAVLPSLSDFEVNTIGLTEVRANSSSTYAHVTSALRTAVDAEQRGQRALRMICDAYSAEGGHLYVIRGNQELERTASQGPYDATEAQLKLAQSCFDQAMNQDDVATEMVSETTGLGTGVAVLWTQDGSVEHRTLMISARVEGALRHAAVAVLISASTKPKPDAIATLSAVGKLLLELGDTTGVIAFN
jgi:tetratricopeptide (TPR) repeat protein